MSDGVCISTPQSATDYLVGLREKNYSTGHINGFVGLCRVYAHFLKSVGLMPSEEIENLKFVPNRFRVRSTMSDQEITDFLTISVPMSIHKAGGKIVTHPVNPDKHDYWTLFFEIMAFTGMRPQEVSTLRVEDVDFGRGVFYLRPEIIKTNRFDRNTNDSRYVPIPPNIEDKLKIWISNQQKGFLFKSSREDGHTSNAEVGYNFRTRIKRLGIVRPNLVPYSLRHSAATRWLEEDVSLAKVQKILGHKDIKTTAIYTHMTTKDIIEMIKKDRMVRQKLNPEEIISGIEALVDKTEISKDPRFSFKKERKSGKLLIELSINSDIL